MCLLGHQDDMRDFHRFCLQKYFLALLEVCFHVFCILCCWPLVSWEKKYLLILLLRAVQILKVPPSPPPPHPVALQRLKIKFRKTNNSVRYPWGIINNSVSYFILLTELRKVLKQQDVLFMPRCWQNCPYYLWKT